MASNTSAEFIKNIFTSFRNNLEDKTVLRMPQLENTINGKELLDKELTFQEETAIRLVMNTIEELLDNSSNTRTSELCFSYEDDEVGSKDND